MCSGSAGLCQKSRPFAWAKSSAVYTAVANASNTSGQARMIVAPGTPSSFRSTHNVSKPPKAVMMYAPRTSQLFHWGISNT